MEGGKAHVKMEDNACDDISAVAEAGNQLTEMLEYLTTSFPILDDHDHDHLGDEEKNWAVGFMELLQGAAGSGSGSGSSTCSSNHDDYYSSFLAFGSDYINYSSLVLFDSYTSTPPPPPPTLEAAAVGPIESMESSSGVMLNQLLLLPTTPLINSSSSFSSHDHESTATPTPTPTATAPNHHHHHQLITIDQLHEDHDDQKQQQLKTNKHEYHQLKPNKKSTSEKKKKKKKKVMKEPRFAFVTKSEVDHLEDGFRWRKYGQKAVKNSPFPRSYYRCTTAACNVKKRVERSFEDPTIIVTTYEGKHTHQTPLCTIPRTSNPPSTARLLHPGSGFGFSAASTSTTFATMPMKPPRPQYQPPQMTLMNKYYLPVPLINSCGYTSSTINPSINSQRTLCIPNSALLTDHGLLQDIVPSFIGKEE